MPGRASSVLHVPWAARLTLIFTVLMQKYALGDDPVGKPAVYIGGNWEVFDENDPPGTPQPFPPKSDSWKSDNTTIMVSMASFRDHRCPKTLYNLFTKAKNPKRVYAGVVQQNDEGDTDCLYGYCKMIMDERGLEPKVAEVGNEEENPEEAPGKILNIEDCPYADQVRMMRVQSKDAKGPTYGRYLGGKLIGEEEFCMQTDAHMDYEDFWDQQLLNMWGLTDNEYAVLTTYVPDLPQLHTNPNDRFEVPQVCKAYFEGPGKMVRNHQATNCIWLTKPKLTTTWAAGLSFSKCHADKRTPYDPHLPSVFDGEEYSKYVRLWTRGYDTYTPHRNVVYHDYTHGPQTKKATAWARQERELEQSLDRLRTLFDMPGATVPRNNTEARVALMQRWDLGHKRTMDQLIAFTGIDTRNMRVLFDNCGKRQWVPFVEGEDDDFFDPHDAGSFEGMGDRIPTQDNAVLLQPNAQARDATRVSPSSGKAMSGIIIIMCFVAIWACLTFTPRLAEGNEKAVKTV